MYTLFKPAARSLAACLILCAQAAFAQTANFTSDETEGCLPLTVNFTDASTGTVTTWFWDFGNGNTSTLQNPSVIFSEPGAYTVSLTVSNGGAPNTRIRGDYIVVHDQPTVDFTSSITEGCAPLSVKFNDKTSTAEGQISSWFWVFGDGGTSTAANPTYVFKEPGNRIVSLKVINEHGCVKTKSISSPIKVLGPLTKFKSDKEAVCTLPATFQFTNQTTGSNLTYKWDFGDGQKSTATNPSHTFNSAGTFNVTLTATDGNGCETTFKLPVNAGSEGGLDFTASGLKVCKNQPVDFELVSSDAPISALWEFGDGATATTNEATHTYTNPGTYTVTLTSLLLNHTCNSIVKKTIVVAAPAQPTFSTKVDCDYNLTLTSTSQNATRLEWYIGDELVSTLQSFVSPIHAPGPQNVKLVAFDAADCHVQLEQTVFVQSNPIALFEPDELQSCNEPSLSGCAPFPLQFTNKTISNEPVTLKWEFGDGGTTTEASPFHTYVSKGLYQVTLTAMNNRGCKGTMTSFVTVADQTPVAGFTMDKTTACAGEEITFTDASTNADFWCWDFGDGGTGNGEEVKYKYKKPGKYTVTLTAKNAGCADQKTIVNAITIKDPHIDFTWTKSCGDPYKVTLNDNSSGYDAGQIHWEFGDGETSDNLNIGTHTYDEEGTYLLELVGSNASTQCTVRAQAIVTIQDVKADFEVNTDRPCKDAPLVFTDKSHAVANWKWSIAGESFVDPSPSTKIKIPGNYDAELEVTDTDGCKDVKTIPILVLNMQGDFRFKASSTCDEFTVAFENESSGIPDPTVWEWNFGDGETSDQEEPVHVYDELGKYTVSLSVTNADGTCVFSNDNAIAFTNPVPSFQSAKTNFCPGDNVQIANTTKFAKFYEWDYGDGRRSDFVSPLIPYTAEGSYDITLFALDEYGCEKKFVEEQFVVIDKPVASFSVESASGACPPFTALFSDESVKDIEEWQWDFGDGQTSSLQDPANLYQKPGSFNVKLTVTDKHGCTDEKIEDQFVRVGGATGNFVNDGASQCTNQTIAFSSNTTNAATLRWDFGDGVVVESTNPTLSHTYTSTGTFTPTLVLIDIAGCQTVADGSMELQIRDTTAVSLSIAPACIKPGEPFELKGVTEVEDDIIHWAWSIDGVGVGDGESYQAALDESGVHIVTTIATNKFNCISHAIDTMRVQGPITMIPNVITPNGDGANQSFKVSGIEGSTWNIDIVNRWGNTVYSKNGYNNDWDGDEQPAGVYYYILRNAVCEERDYKGFISVVR